VDHDQEPTKFFVKFTLDDGDVKSARFSLTGEFVEVNTSEVNKAEYSDEEQLFSPFRRVLKDFRREINIYVDFVPLMLSTNALWSKVLSGENLKKFAERFGEKKEEKPSSGSYIYEIPIEKLPEFHMQLERSVTYRKALLHIPQVMIIGLVSVYDHLFSNILTALYRFRSELVLTSEKNIPFSELTAFHLLMRPRNLL